MRLKPANICIYCFGEPDGSDEHIVPQALYGRILLPNATCGACKETINKHIEGPLLGFHYKKTRAARGYKSKRRGSRKKVSSHENNWSFVLKRRVPPFEKYVAISPPDDPITYIHYKMLPPPFLAKKFPDIRKKPLIEVRHPMELDWVQEEQARLRRSDQDIISIQTQTPIFRKDLIPRQVLKIACGAFFGFLKVRCHTELRQAILGSAPKTTIDTHVKSASQTLYPLGKREIKIFTEMEMGKKSLYMSIRLLPEDIDENYFVRVGVPNTFADINLSFDYAK